MTTLNKHIVSKAFFKPPNPIVVCLSGGVDSMVLFDVLKSLNQTMIIAHVNHKQRPASDDEYTAIKTLAKKHNIPFEGLVITDEITGNFQAETRKKRRIFFKSVAKKYNAKHIVLAHHQDDQIETILMRFIKGYSLSSLKGMSPLQHNGDYQIVRPFLDIKKSALLEYAHKHKIVYYEDSSNISNAYMRNRLRNDIIPKMLEENPNLHETMSRYQTTFTDIDDLINDHTKTLLKKWPTKIPITSFITLNPLIQTQLIKTKVAQLSPDDSSLSQGIIDTILDIVKTSDTNSVHPVNATVNFHKEYTDFFFAKSVQKSPKSITISKEGIYRIDEHSCFLVSHQNLTHIHSNYCVLWYNDKVFPVFLRNRKEGDKIHCSFGTKKVKDILIDKKISPSKRDTIILLANDEEVLWIPFLKISKHQNEKHSNKLYIYEV